MTNLAITANGLRRSYGDKVVLDGIDLAVPEGTIFSLLGPNGAGKTTAVNILPPRSPPTPPPARSTSVATTSPSTRRRSTPPSASPGSSPPSTG